MNPIWNLNWFNTGEYQVIEERLADLKKLGITTCPLDRRNDLRALKETSYDNCKVVIFGQDPYPNPSHATGIAFDIPSSITKDKFPPTLKNIFKEYCDDLHYPEPTTGTLLPWCEQGVLLYNIIPTCTAYRSMSHSNWWEYQELTKEIIDKLNSKEEVVFVFLGSRSREFLHKVDSKHKVLTYSHPSPLGVVGKKSNNFLGSRMFTTINSLLSKPIDWRLP